MTYTETKITKSNAAAAKLAIAKLVETCDWVNGAATDIIILRSGSDYAAIPAPYFDGGSGDFYSVGGRAISPADEADENFKFYAVVAE